MLKIGKKIRIEKRIDGETTVEMWTVEKIYPYVVLCRNAKGIKTCFSIGDLIMNDIIKQSDELEALKAFG